MTKIGDVLRSDDEAYPELRVVAGDIAAGRWIVQETDGFSSGPRLLSNEEAAAYGGVTDAPVQADEQAGWDSLATAHTRGGRRILSERPLTPEQALLQGAASEVSADGGGWAVHPGFTFTDDASWLRKPHAPSE